MVVSALIPVLLVGVSTPVSYDEEVHQFQIPSTVVSPKVSATPIVVVVLLVPTLLATA